MSSSNTKKEKTNPRTTYDNKHKLNLNISFCVYSKWLHKLLNQEFSMKFVETR
jgi:hypothetical protein